MWWGKGYLEWSCASPLLAHFPLGYYYRLFVHIPSWLLPFCLSIVITYTGLPIDWIHANTRVSTSPLPYPNYLTYQTTATIYIFTQNHHKNSRPSPKMPIFRTLTTKLKTSLSSSPDSSPEQSPTSPQVSSFAKINGRKEASVSGAVKRPEVQARADSYMTQSSNASNESVEEKKQRRMSRFREELDFEAED